VDLECRATCGLDGKKGTNGGVWEWTSTLFGTHDGFEATDIFSGYVAASAAASSVCFRFPADTPRSYSSDFFDGKHHVVVRPVSPPTRMQEINSYKQLGASYATIPRQAGRRTLRNFYQHNYPYAWVGGRVVYDGEA
jgi:formylglycine-generating enzyme required for sulfatase activity